MTAGNAAPARVPGDAPGLERALAAARALAPALPAEHVPLDALAGRRLARPVVARTPLPPFSNSAMDGYAVRAADTPGRLTLAGVSAAGRLDPGSLASGQAWRISTGAPLPPGADAVVRQEHAARDGAAVTVPAVRPGADVRHRGEDLGAGVCAIAAGSILAPHDAGVVAACGHAGAWCVRPARVAILLSGDELVPAGAALGPSQIPDSNRHALRAQAIAAGASVTEVAAVGDDAAETRAAVRRLLDGGETPPDLLVCAGGLSVGPNDHLRDALAAAGVVTVVPRVRMRPGGPTWIGRRGPQRVLALPGNPVAATVCFHVFGRALLGHHDDWDDLNPTAVPISRRPGATTLLRCRASPGGLVPLERQGSGAVASMAGAQILAWIPEGSEALPAGTPVRTLTLGGA